MGHLWRPAAGVTHPRRGSARANCADAPLRWPHGRLRQAVLSRAGASVPAAAAAHPPRPQRSGRSVWEHRESRGPLEPPSLTAICGMTAWLLPCAGLYRPFTARYTAPPRYTDRPTARPLAAPTFCQRPLPLLCVALLSL